MDALLAAFEGVFQVFKFIYSVLETIVNGIYGCFQILTNIFATFNGIFRLMPTELYIPFLSFLNLYIVISLFKLIKK